MKRVSLILLPCLLVVVLAGLFLHPVFAHSSTLPLINCGKGWTVVSSPNPSPLFEAQFVRVAAISANDVWAIGISPHKGGPHALIEHWNGGAWRIVPSANPKNPFLSGIAGVATNDVWAVGSDIEHWNGTSWNLVPNPTGYLKAVVALSSTDIWAVGGNMGSTSTIHWNGTAWSVVPSPSPTKESFLTAVTAVSSTDVWAAGYELDHSLTQAFFEHWNGKNWKLVASPPLYQSNLSDITAVSTTDIWAIGTYQNGWYRPLIEHWDGTKWTIDPFSRLQLNESLSAISAISKNDIWVVGVYDLPTTYLGQAFIAHWNGTNWTIVANPPVPNPLLGGITRVPGTANLWAVGAYFNTDSTLTEYYC